MKHIIILGDGMADEPIEQLGGLTPLEAADTPAMDLLAKMGRSGIVSTVPEGFPPGSEIANMGILGYDVREAFEGRGVLEAASMGVEIAPGQLAMRCNLICLNPDGTIKNHSAGHITTAEAAQLIDALNSELGHDGVKFHPGVSYRHLLTIDGGDKRVDMTPPHDVPGADSSTVMPKAQVTEAEATAQKINALITASQHVLANHPVNLDRQRRGLDPANSIWPWSAGYRPAMTPLTDTGAIKSGTVISAVDLIKGIGILAGLKSVDVEGATGLYDTNYEGKTQAAIQALRDGADLVFLHVEASDEAGHEGNIDLKIKTIENLDHRVVGPIIEAAKTLGEPLTIALLPDHPTPCRLRTHTSAPVPFTIARPGESPDSVDRFSEQAAKGGSYGHIYVTQFINILLTH